MTDKTWSGRVVDPFDEVNSPDDDKDYRPWRTSSQGWVRDLKFVPAPGSGEPSRFEPYMQAISLELDETETTLCLMCHTSGQVIFVHGRQLSPLADLISAKRAQSVHVWCSELGDKPDAVVTAVTFDKSASDRLGSE